VQVSREALINRAGALPPRQRVRLRVRPELVHRLPRRLRVALPGGVPASLGVACQSVCYVTSHRHWRTNNNYYRRRRKNTTTRQSVLTARQEGRSAERSRPASQASLRAGCATGTRSATPGETRSTSSPRARHPWHPETLAPHGARAKGGSATDTAPPPRTRMAQRLLHASCVQRSVCNAHATVSRQRRE